MRYILSKRQILLRKFRAKRPKPLLFPVSIEMQYKAALMNLIASWKKEYNSIIIPALPVISGNFRNSINVDDWQEDLEYYVVALEAAIMASIVSFKSAVNAIADRVIEWNSKQWHKHTESVLGKSLILRNTHKSELKAVFMEKNLTQVKALANETISKMKLEAVNAIPKGIKPKVNLTPVEKKAKLLTSLGISEFNTALYKDEQLNSGINEYIWRTMLDEKVRVDHRPMEGMICNWNDPTVFKYEPNGKWLSRAMIGGIMLHPGEDYNCRCYPEANFSQLL